MKKEHQRATVAEVTAHSSDAEDAQKSKEATATDTNVRIVYKNQKTSKENSENVQVIFRFFAKILFYN